VALVVPADGPVEVITACLFLILAASISVASVIPALARNRTH
jgi:hypothetical protein